MDLSRNLLLSLAILGLQIGLAAGAEPPPQPTSAPPVSEVVPAPASAQSPPAQAVPTYTPVAEPAPLGGDATTRSGLISGVGLYILQPYFSNNQAFIIEATAGRTSTTPGNRTDTHVDISHHMEVAPLIWLGYMADNGLGVRARWWYFREGSDQSVTAPTGEGAPQIQVFSAAPLGLALGSLQQGQTIAAMEVTSKLELQAADLEALDEINAGPWNFLLAGGLRIAQINQTYNAFSPLQGMTTLLSSQSFQGVGPTLALEARRPVGIMGLTVFGSARGSVVFGSAHQSAVLPDTSAGAEDHRDVGMPIGELELGLEYSRVVGGSRLFGQVALVGQDWFGAGNASRSSSGVLPGGNVNGSPGAYTGDSDIEFLGLSIRLGVNY
jgi:hypothetical protein